MPWVAAVVVAGAAIANYMSNMSAQDRAEAARNKALQELLAVQIPDPEQQRIALERFVQTGELTPQLQQAIKAQPTEFKNIVTDPGLKAHQMSALDELADIGHSGGLRLQDKAALQEAQMEANVRDRGSREAIEDNMERRGMGGSGFRLQAELEGQQAAGDRAAHSSLDIAAKANERALQAIIGAGDMATKYRGQDFEEQSAKARAADAINMFNTRNLQDVNNANVGIRNSADAANLAAKQRIADQNVTLTNHEQEYNKGLSQQNFQNQMAMANARNGIYNQQAQGELARGQQQGNLYTNLGQAGAGTATAYQAGEDRRESQAFAAQEREKDRQAYMNAQSSTGNQYGNNGGAAGNYTLLDNYFGDPYKRSYQ